MRIYQIVIAFLCISILSVKADNNFLSTKHQSCKANNGQSCYELSEYYGKNGHIDVAREYLEKAAELGFAEAQAMLGWRYSMASYYPKDIIKAKFWLQKAAAQNHPVATYNLGVIYEREQDYKNALKFYQKAASLGESDAWNNLGTMYDNGYGVKKDSKKAFRYYEQSAKQDNTIAYYNLGLMYANGTGVDQNLKEAKINFNYSCEKGLKAACEKLADMQKSD